MSEKITFDQLGLSKRVLEAVYKKGFEEPSPIQSLTIPVMLRNNTNIIAQAQTGTGKTAAFGLPLIEMINTDERTVQALILAPTRELAIQVSEEINSLKGNSNLQIIPVYGGQSIDQQLRRLKKGVHIVVGTPGRIIDHLKRKTLNLQNIEHLVLDEADEMLNMGFIEDMEEIMKYTNPEKRTLLFSATMPDKIKKLANKYMKGYEFISVKHQTLTTNLTEQLYYEVKVADKFEALCRIIDIEENFYGLVFCRTKNDVDTVVRHLQDRGYDADAIHGDITQPQREKVLSKFKTKKINVLVATDVAARGIDVENMSHVINYSLPQDPESYVHRIGRTGRAGKEGTAITFITPSEYKQLMFIQRVSKSEIKRSTLPNAKDIIKIKKNRILDDLSSMNAKELDESYYNWAQQLIAQDDPAMVLSKLLYYCFDDELDPSLYSDIKPSSSHSRDRSSSSSYTSSIEGKQRHREPEGQARLFVAMGKKDDLTPKKLVDFIMKNTGVRNSLIDKVEVMDSFSFISVPLKEAEIILGAFQSASRNKKPLVVKAKAKR